MTGAICFGLFFRVCFGLGGGDLLRKALRSGFAFFFFFSLLLGAVPLAIIIDYELEDRTYVLGSNVEIFF